MNKKNSILLFKDNKYVTELSPKDFNPIATWKIKDKKCSIILFYVDWCPFCQSIKNEYIKFAKTAGFIEVYAFNCEFYKSHTLKIKEDMPELIKAYPTIIIYKNGEPIEQFMKERTASNFLSETMRICEKK